MVRYGWWAVAGAMAIAMPAKVEGQITSGRLAVLTLESTIFGNTRKLRVWLPEAYDDPLRAEDSFPVLYLNDGQNLFDPATALFGDTEWRVDETVAWLIETGQIEPVVVVGIDNAGARGRAREYLPYPDEFLDPPEPNPQGTRYSDFLAEEALPLTEQRFRVRRERSGRTLGGSSYGALVSLYVAVQRPDLFANLLLESPSLYVDDQRVLDDAALTGVGVDRIYIGVGTNELAIEGCAPHPGNEEAVQHVYRLESILRARGLKEQDVFVRVEECAVHKESAWADRLPSALQFLFHRRGTR